MSGSRAGSCLGGVDLRTLGARGAAVAWGEGNGAVVGLVQVRNGRLSARMGIALRRGPLEAMAAALLDKGGGSLIVVGGADAPKGALDLVLCRRGDAAANLARMPDAASARDSHAAAVGGLVAEALGESAYAAAAFVAAAGLPAVAAEPLVPDTSAGACARDLAVTAPLLAMALLSRREGAAALSAGVTPSEACAAAFPGFTPGHARRLAGVGLDALDDVLRAPAAMRSAAAVETLRMLGQLPPEWMPSGGDWSHAAMAAMALDASYVLDPGCLRAARGDWAGLAARVRRLCGVAPDEAPVQALDRIRSAACDLGDASAALGAQLLLPLAAHLHETAGFVPRLDGPGDLETACLALARDVLYGGRGMAACFEVSARWHARQDAVSSAFMTASPDMGWAVPFGAGTVETGEGPVDVVPIGDALSLHEEGRAGPDRNGAAGLDHCVFGRLGAALRGDAHVVSLRVRTPGGGYERLSTAQIDLGRVGFTVAEHQGRANALPPGRCVEALDILARRLADVPLDVLPRAGGRPDPVRDACGYDWRDAAALGRALRAWEPMLPRRLRGLGLEGLASALPGLAPEAARPGLLAA